MIGNIVLKGKKEVLDEMVELVKKMNGTGKYKFHFTLIVNAAIEVASLTIVANDSMHFFMLGILSQNIMQKLYNAKVSSTTAEEK